MLSVKFTWLEAAVATALVLAVAAAATLARRRSGSARLAGIAVFAREAGMLLKIGFPDLLVWWVGKPTVDDLRLARAVKDREATAPLPVIYVNGAIDAQRLADKLAGLRG